MTSDALLTGLWRHRVGVVVGALALWLAAVGVVLLIPRAPVARAVVAPAETTGIAASSLLLPLPQFGAGLIEQRPSGNFAVYLGALRGREAALVLRRDTELAQRLAADRAEDPLARALATLGLGGGEPLDDDQMAWLRRNTAATQSPASVLWTIEAREPDLGVRQALYGLIAEAHRHAAVLAADPALAARGHDVTLLCGRHEGAAIGSEAAFRRGVRRAEIAGCRVIQRDIPYANAIAARARARAEALSALAAAPERRAAMAGAAARLALRFDRSLLAARFCAVAEAAAQRTRLPEGAPLPA
jgi:hypothetical protein